jgi:hypothetical protein
MPLPVTLDRLSAEQKEQICRLYFVLGKKVQDIADEFHVPPNYIYRVINTSPYAEQVSSQHEITLQKLSDTLDQNTNLVSSFITQFLTKAANPDTIANTPIDKLTKVLDSIVNATSRLSEMAIKNEELKLAKIAAQNKVSDDGLMKDLVAALGTSALANKAEKVVEAEFEEAEELEEEGDE